jgi:hypothetical protein
MLLIPLIVTIATAFAAKISIAAALPTSIYPGDTSVHVQW